jgi:hypothetical protein
VHAAFRKKYAEKLEANEPWWETDWPQPQPRINSAWATLPPRTSLQDVQALVASLDGVNCDSALLSESEDEDETEEAAAAATAALVESLEAVADDPAAHRMLRRQSGDPCIVAHAVAEQLAVELARERSESFALEVRKLSRLSWLTWAPSVKALLRRYVTGC